MSEADQRGIEDVVMRLAETVGMEKARQVADALLARMDNPTPQRLLDALEEEPGLVGAAARVAKLRRRSSGVTRLDDRDAAPVSSQAPASDAGRLHAPPTIEVAQLASLFAESLGNDKSHEIVTAALKRANLPLTGIDERAALATLEGLAREPGIVGVTARFAKARLILLFPRA